MGCIKHNIFSKKYETKAHISKSIHVQFNEVSHHKITILGYFRIFQSLKKGQESFDKQYPPSIVAIGMAQI